MTDNDLPPRDDRTYVCTKCGKTRRVASDPPSRVGGGLWCRQCVARRFARQTGSWLRSEMPKEWWCAE